MSLQVRQAEKNQRSLMQQGRATRASDAALKLAEESLAPVFTKGLNGDESMSNVEVDRFMSLARSAFLNGEDAFLHRAAGQIDDATWRSVVVSLRSFLRAPGLRAAWRLSANQYGEDFVMFMNGILSETPVAPASDRLAAWVEAVRAEKAQT